jgi:hypothetical protein
MLLILTSSQDLTADFLIVALIERSLLYFRLNAEDLADARYRFTDDGVRSIDLGARALDLNSITAVWYRRAIHPTPSHGESTSEGVFIAGELRHLVFGMAWNPNILWVNPIDKVYVAEHKLYQLEVAKNLGFRVPRTLVSTDPAELRAFTLSNARGTICKPIFHGLFFDGADSYSIYTRNVVADEFTEGMLLGGPVLLQEEIQRGSDLRITFVGNRCFAAQVNASFPAVDWRTPEASASFSIIEMDAAVQDKCEAMLNILGLRYGAFDFIRSPEGQWFFLEINPTGEWAWLENSLGFPMRDAFVELFYGGENA